MIFLLTRLVASQEHLADTRVSAFFLQSFGADPLTPRTRGSAAYCERFPTRPANRAPHFFGDR